MSFARDRLLLATVALSVSAAACGDSDADGAATSTTATTGSSSGGSGGQGATGGDAPGGSGPGGRGGGGDGGRSAGGGAGEGGSGGSIEPPPGRLRVVAANLTSGNGQSYDPKHGVRILQGLDADVILLQEVNYGSNSTADIDELVESICFGECGYVRGPPAEIPNGVLSRLPIVESGSWTDPEVSNRNFVWARINVAGPADLWAISVHLLSTSASARNLEAIALLNAIGARVPASDLVVLGGDLNTTSRTEAAVTTLGGYFTVGGPYPADQQGNDMTNAPRSSPYDWVVADEDLTLLHVPVEIGQTTFPVGAVIDTRVYVPLSEIAPALPGDSDAPGMQHMAVIRDYWIDE